MCIIGFGVRDGCDCVTALRLINIRSVMGRFVVNKIRKNNTSNTSNPKSYPITAVTTAI